MFSGRKRLKESIKKLKKTIDETNSRLEELEREKALLETSLEETKKSNEKNRRLAYYDYITGLPNRFVLTDMLEGTMKTLRKDENLVLIYLDLEYLEELDGRMSYAYKDELLVDITDRLRQAVDESDLLACVDGDRFIVLIQNPASAEEVEEKVKRIAKVFSYPFVLAATEIFMNINMGICFGPRDGKTAQTLLKNLNTALFAAKEKGKNQYCYFEEELSKEMMSRIELQSQLRSGIENQEFEVYYQPQIDLKTEKVKGFEALLRWNHPTRGVLSQESFLPLAEESGLIVSIGEWVIREACTQLKHWEQMGYSKLVISINLSLRQIREKNMVNEIEKILEELQVDKSCLIFEIAEKTIEEEGELAFSQMKRLKELGVKLALDHFGMGLSYLEPLKEISPDAFKLDRAFVECEGKFSVPAAKAVAKAYGAALMAGGVERVEQKKILLEGGCTWAQGFLYSGPVPAKEAEELLKW
jgi:polar amino acid transport system substrate-binding protein